MKAKIYFDPFKKTSFDQIVEILEMVNVPKRITNSSTEYEITASNLFKRHGLKKALVKYPDGTINDNVFFDPNDIIY